MAHSDEQAPQTPLSTDNYVTKKLCIVASEGDKTRLIQAIKSSGLSKHYMAKHVKCNELDLVNFIDQYLVM